MPSVSKRTDKAPDSNVNGAGKPTSFNFEDFRLGQDFISQARVAETITNVPVIRPDKQYWVFVSSDEDWRTSMAVIEDRDNRQTYLLRPELLPDLDGEYQHKLLVSYCTRQGTVALWPIRLPDETGRLDSYNESALHIVTLRSGRWIRIRANQQSRSYVVIESPQNERLPAPQWPGGGLNHLLEIAFRGRIIDTLDHPYLRHLRGEV